MRRKKAGNRDARSELALPKMLESEHPFIRLAYPLAPVLRSAISGQHSPFMRKVLERDGYVCDDLLKETHDFHCKKDGTIKKPTKQTGLRTLFDMYGYQLIIFSCDVFGVCQQNMREIGQLIVDGGILSQMYIDRLTWPDFSGYSPKQKEILVICGDGDEGDKLCVNEDGDLILLKGRYGSENPFGKGN